MSNKVIKNINLTFVLLFLIGTSLFVIYPLMYVISGAFAPGNSIATLSIIPFGDGITFKHFEDLFTKTNYGKWFQNTLYVATCTSLATVVVASLGAYVFSRFQFAMKKSMMMTMLILQIFPSFVGMVAIYVILLRIGGLDTLWGLILVYLAGNIPYNTWMVKSYMDTIPKSLDEAARIDGASHFKIFTSVILPVARPIIIFLGISSFTAPWMDYIFPKMVLRSSDKQTLALGLYSSFLTEKKNEFTTFAAGALLIAIPFILFFMVMQKTMITSMGGAAVKE